LKFKKSNLNKYFLLNLKKVLFIFIAEISSIFLHNFIYALFKPYFDSTGGDEPFFFILAIVIIPIYFLISVFYSLFVLVKKKFNSRRFFRKP
jgi:hypothetical protein